MRCFLFVSLFCSLLCTFAVAEKVALPDMEKQFISLEQELLQDYSAEPLPSVPEKQSANTSADLGQISLKQVFASSPFIYAAFLSMSCISIALCLYVLLRLKEQTRNCDYFFTQVQAKFSQQDMSQIRKLCTKQSNWLSRMIGAGMDRSRYGIQAILDGMKVEGKRATLSAWQQLSILQDIAIIAPMLGLLGTVIGLFYAFYDLHRSLDSLSHLLDGLGVSVGTTVAGICVAILAMVLHSLAKFRLVRCLSNIEVRASSLAYLIEDTDKP